MALLRAMLEIKSTQGGQGQLQVVHIDHGLREQESTADAAAVDDDDSSSSGLVIAIAAIVAVLAAGFVLIRSRRSADS